MANHKKRAEKSQNSQKNGQISKLISDNQRLQGELNRLLQENKRLTQSSGQPTHLAPPSANDSRQSPPEKTTAIPLPRLAELTTPENSAIKPVTKKGPAPVPAMPDTIIAPATKAPPPDANSRRHPSTIAQLNRCVAQPIITNTSNLLFRGFHITDEQQHGFDLAMQGFSLKINAGAGTGKTTQLAAISHAFGSGHGARHTGVYVAFNKSIVAHARTSFHQGTKCSTGHGLAFSGVGSHFANRGRLEGRLTANIVAQALGLGDFYHMSPVTVGALLMAWISKFCQGSDKEIGLSNVPWDFMKTLTLEGDKAKAYEVGKEYAMELAPLAKRLWEKLSRYNETLPVTHDVYLKLWALGNPRIYADLIYFDESQDASPVLLEVIEAQKAQKIWVGDRRQQIYAWRGAVNAMDKIHADHITSLTQSFRFGQPIAELANSVLRNFLNETEFAVTGSPFVKSTIERIKNPTAYLCRTNRSAISELMRALSNRKRVHITGGVQDLICDIESADALMTGRRPRSPAFHVFKDWGELVEYSESPAGGDMKPLVKLIDQWGVSNLLSALGQVHGIKKESADIVIATAHKTKGLEFDTVALADDFVPPPMDKFDPNTSFSEEEANLLYVASTRAKLGLDISNCSAAKIAMEANE